MFSESASPLSSAFVHHALLLDLAFKQSADGSVPFARIARTNSAHSRHTMFVREFRFRGRPGNVFLYLLKARLPVLISANFRDADFRLTSVLEV